MSERFHKKVHSSGSESKLNIYDLDDDDHDATEPEDGASKRLLVAGFQSDTHEESIEMFFESKKKSGGGSIKRFVYNKEKQEALIEFKNWKGERLALMSLSSFSLWVKQHVKNKFQYIMVITNATSFWSYNIGLTLNFDNCNGIMV